MQDSFKATAIPISAAVLMSMLGVGMMVPALPQLATQTSHAGVAAGALIGAYGFSRLLFNTASGIFTDHFGISRSAYLGLLLLAVDSVFGYFATGFAALLAVMAVQGAASSLFSTAAMTALVLKAGPRSRGRAMAWFQTSLLLGFAIGPVIGGQLVDHIGPHTPFMLQAVIALVALATVRTMPSAPAAAHGAAPAAIGLRSLLGPALLIGGLGGFAAFFCRFGVAWNLVPVAALQEFHLSNSELGWIVGSGTVANLMVTPFLGQLVDGWGAKPSFITACILNVAGMVALFAAPGHVMLWVATAIVMFATGIMIPAAGALALTGAKPQVTGRVMGLFRTIGESGMAFGPVVVPAVTAAAHLPILSGLLPCMLVAIVALAAASFFRSYKTPPAAVAATLSPENQAPAPLKTKKPIR
jgi:MFS family permease